MTEKIYIYGAGGHGLVCADIALSMGYKEVIFIDDEKKKCIAFSPDLPKYDIFVAIGDNKMRRWVFDKVEKHGFECVNLIHPSAVVSQNATLVGKNIAIMPNAVINAFAAVGFGTIINTGAVVEHESRIGSFAHIAVGAKVCGHVSVGDSCLVGAGAVIIPNLWIFDEVVIGAGAVVVRNIHEKGVFVGNPARKISP